MFGGDCFCYEYYMFKNMRCQVVRLTPQRTHHLNESGTKMPFKRQIMGNPTIIWHWPRMMWTDCILFKLVKLQFAYLAGWEILGNRLFREMVVFGCRELELAMMNHGSYCDIFARVTT